MNFFMHSNNVKRNKTNLDPAAAAKYSDEEIPTEPGVAELERENQQFVDSFIELKIQNFTPLEKQATPTLTSSTTSTTQSTTEPTTAPTAKTWTVGGSGQMMQQLSFGTE